MIHTWLNINNIRTWLYTNKIFFETLVALLLAFMAITLTVVSINVSDKSNEIAFYEIEIMKMENLPIFQFTPDINSIYVGNNLFFAKERLIISNIGKPVKEIDCSYIIFLKIHLNSEYALIPINDYYYYQIHTTNLTGELISFQSKLYYDQETGNRLEISKADYNFSEFAKRQDDYGYIDVLRFIKVEYIDIFNNLHEEIYFVDSVLGSHKLNEEEKTTIEDYYLNFEYANTVSISNLSPDILYEKWLMIFNKSIEIQNIIH